MSIVMDGDGRVRPFQVSDLKEVAERDIRIEQLERLNATLAAQVDRMEKVVEAAIDMQEHGCGQCESQFNVAVITCKEQMAALGKGGGG